MLCKSQNSYHFIAMLFNRSKSPNTFFTLLFRSFPNDQKMGFAKKVFLAGMVTLNQCLFQYKMPFK